MIAYRHLTHAARAWADESYALAVAAYGGIVAGDTPSPAHEARWRRVTSKRVALAGYRLAALLNAHAPKG